MRGWKLLLHLPGEGNQQHIERGEDEPLPMARQGFEHCHAARDRAGRRAPFRRGRGGFRQQPVIQRDAQGEREADGHLGREPEPVVFVIGDEGLQDADPLGELRLSQPAFAAEANQAAADGLTTIIEGRQSEA